jgi:steroid 5-alpha reductase family enzyme
MIISIIGFAFIIILTIFAYRTAKDYERNAAVWAVITFFSVFGVQIILPFLIGLIIAVLMLVSGTPPEKLQESFNETVPAVTITVLCIVLSVVAGFLILRYLSKIPEEKSFDVPPAPPTNFNQNS